MAFKVVFLAHAPDAEPVKHRGVVETSKYKLFSVVVKDQVQAGGLTAPTCNECGSIYDLRCIL